MKDSYTFWPVTESIVRFLLSVGPFGSTYQEQRRNEMSNPLRWWNFWVLNDEKYGYPARNPRYGNKPYLTGWSVVVGRGSAAIVCKRDPRIL